MEGKINAFPHLINTILCKEHSQADNTQATCKVTSTHPEGSQIVRCDVFIVAILVITRTYMCPERLIDIH